jgi:uncharacterized protein YbjT (DUF2867 family)
MRILIFGTSGMVGQGAMREALLDTRVSEVLSVVRAPLGKSCAKLTEIVLPDLTRIAGIADRLTGFDACFFCLGVSSLGMSEADYTRITHDLTMTIAEVLLPRNPAMTFIYVSGLGTDRDSRQMWPRVKARTEDALAAMGFKAAFAFRPGFIQPLHGVTSKTSWYAAIYALTGPISGALTRWFPGFATTTERLGRAMINVVASGYPLGTLENADINEAGHAQA